MLVKLKTSIVYKGSSMNIGETLDLDNSLAKELIACNRAIMIIDETKKKKSTKKRNEV
ncbi:hypothetical protein [uncultured Clostridium sp.]|uniref:hypothetical protein n=1 Tax=uncultured Clostridium sp. TaxID=59620 RepID=UPI0025EDEE2A|nr:hypothetical protein [uncultured Clostridium sp.]